MIKFYIDTHVDLKMVYFIKIIIIFFVNINIVCLSFHHE
jgi:hypothetical protein